MATNTALSELTRDNKGRFVKIRKACTKKKAKKKEKATVTENPDHDYDFPSPKSTETRRSASPCPTSGTSSSSDWRVGQRLVEWEMLLTGLKSCKSCLLGPVPLTICSVIGELKRGMSGYLFVQCQNVDCGYVNRVRYGKGETPSAGRTNPTMDDTEEPPDFLSLLYSTPLSTPLNTERDSDGSAEPDTDDMESEAQRMEVEYNEKMKEQESHKRYIQQPWGMMDLLMTKKDRSTPVPIDTDYSSLTSDGVRRSARLQDEDYRPLHTSYSELSDLDSDIGEAEPEYHEEPEYHTEPEYHMEPEYHTEPKYHGLGNSSKSIVTAGISTSSILTDIRPLGTFRIITVKEEDPDYDPEEPTEEEKHEEVEKKIKKMATDFGLDDSDLDDFLSPTNELDDILKGIKVKKALVNENRIRIKLDEHADKFYEEEIESLQMKDRGKSYEDKVSILMVCALCHHYKTGDRAGLELHIEGHLNGDYDCKDCGEKFESVYKRNVHRELVHNKKGIYTCTECAVTVFTKVSLKHHFASVHGKFVIFCKYCRPPMYMPHKELQGHCVQYHKEKMKMCPKCGKYLKTLKNHSCAQEKLSKVPCEICGSLVSPTYLNAHKRHVHENVRAHKCPQCPYSAKAAGKLRDHIMSKHAGVRGVKCDQCDFRCVQKFQLTSHKRTHTGAKPYKCDKCTFAAPWNGMLKDHRKLHGLPFTVTCPECGVLLKNEKCLTLHQRREHWSNY